MPSQDPGLPYGVSENDIGGPHRALTREQVIDRVHAAIKQESETLAELLVDGDDVLGRLAEILGDCRE